MVASVAAPSGVLGGEVRLTLRPPTAHLLIRHPSRRNALTLEMMGQLADAIARLEGEEELTTCVVSGAGEDFCAGADQYEVAPRLDGDFGVRLTHEMGATLHRLEQLPLVTIAAIDGVALGGGLEVALACTVRLTTADARLGMVQVANGLSAAWGGSTRLCELVGPGRAALLATTGRVLSGDDAAAIGLVDQVVSPSTGVIEGADQLAEEIGHRPAAAVRASVGDVVAWRRDARSTQSFSREQITFRSLWGGAAHRDATERWRT